jgi:hypothetical protein
VILSPEQCLLGRRAERPRARAGARSMNSPHIRGPKPTWRPSALGISLVRRRASNNLSGPSDNQQSCRRPLGIRHNWIRPTCTKRWP